MEVRAHRALWSGLAQRSLRSAEQASSRETTRSPRPALPAFHLSFTFYRHSYGDAHGRADASPKGDAPGFVRVENERTLLIPDRIGNNRIDSLTNLISNPRLGLIFMIPGVAETLRVNGKAEITRDPTLLNSLAAMGKAPKTVIRVTVEEAYLHCGKSIIRAKLWDPEQRVERSTLPSLGRMIADQIEGIDADESDAYIERNYREELY